MLKKTQIFIILVIVMIVVAGVLMLLREIKEKNKQEFLSQLKGEIVYLYKDGLYKFSLENKNIEALMFDRTIRKPQWSTDGLKIYFYALGKINKNKLGIFEVLKDGNDLKELEKRPVDYNLDEANSLSREKDIIVENGDVYYLSGQEKIKIYDYKFKCDSKFCPGASEASWSPDKKYIIFNGNGGIFIADLKGNVFKLTNGADPDWKY